MRKQSRNRNLPELQKKLMNTRRRKLIYIENQQEKIIINDELEKLIRRVVEVGLRSENVEQEVEMSIVMVDAEQMKELNSEYRGIERPTDVLSFAQEDGDIEFPEIEEISFRLLGDIVIALDIALEQSETYQHSFEREVAFLTAHGLLHLLGYDHGDEEGDKDLELMLKRQESILTALELQR
jgi:probable rRNA maturation factor